MEHWGLINYTVNPDIIVPVPRGASSNGTDSTLLQQLFTFKKQEEDDKLIIDKPNDLETRKNIYAAPIKVYNY